jgi:flagellar hook-associated protein 1
MGNLFGLMGIAQSSLLTQQKAIEITGNNIANVNTPGYSRQRVNMVQQAPSMVGNDLVSRGVIADPEIQRFYDQFLSGQLNGENESLGRWQAQKEGLEKVELSFDEATGYGLSSAMGEYWNAWQDLANNPGGVVERSNLISAGQYMSDTFNNISGSLTALQNDADTQVVAIVGDVNAMAEQVAQLNLKITQQEANGNNANSYRDERDQLVFNMAKLIDIDSFEDGDGNLAVMVGNGRPLVEGANSWALSTTPSGSGVQNINWTDSGGNTFDITSQINNGELKGWIETRDVLVTDYAGQLDLLAGTIIDQVNNLHATGLTLEDPVITPNVNFFTGTNAASMAVNSAIVSNSDLVAAAGPGGTLPGDNSNAIAIAALQGDNTFMPGNSTFDNYFNTLIGRVGSDVQAAGFKSDHQTTMVHNLENYRQEVSGVSLDEEMVNLIKFQHAYDAAARMINTANEMLDSLMGILN